jgi:hypothetical protein
MTSEKPSPSGRGWQASACRVRATKFHSTVIASGLWPRGNAFLFTTKDTKFKQSDFSIKTLCFSALSAVQKIRVHLRPSVVKNRMPGQAGHDIVKQSLALQIS